MAISDLNLTIVFILSSFDVVFFSIWRIAILYFLQCPLYQIGSVLGCLHHFLYMAFIGVYCDSSLVCMRYSAK